MTMRFGLLGAGRIGRIHGLNVVARGDARLVAVADASAEAAASLAEAAGANAASVDAILGDAGIDAVLICTPTDTHADLIEAVVSARKAVFCEKPVDLDASRIRRCLKVVAKAGKPLMIGFNRRFDPISPRSKSGCGRGRPARSRSSASSRAIPARRRSNM